ncbi:MAG TPA: type II toxin-antitoxin system RelE/ParE family toxin [Paracoccaceae bacterium]|nr:type II toxin-antitoxin system RelE/ParE family toxin [Paracoccaceae bacterium]
MEVKRTRGYEKDIRRLRLDPSEVEAIERTIVANPDAGDRIPGLLGVRKPRFAMAGRGKRGGGRAIYYVPVAAGQIMMIAAYAKNEQTDLMSTQKKTIIALIKEIKHGNR